MYFVGMGRGGPFTALFGLVTFAVLFCLWVLKWTAVGAICLLIITGRVIHALYLYRKQQKELAADKERLKNPPMPLKSPVN